MVTPAEPLKIAGIDADVVSACVRAVDTWLKAADYDAIIKHVLLKPGADRARLKKEIRIAAVWYLVRIELQLLGATAARQRATFVAFHDKTQAYLRDVINDFPPELRPQLRESRPDEQVQTDPLRAWPSPFAIVEAELEGLSLRAQKAAQSIPRKSKRTFVEARRTMLKAWETATGKSPFKGRGKKAFIEFEIALTSRLNARLKKRKINLTIPAPSRHYVDEAGGK